MKQKVWITWWVIFCIRYSRLLWIYLIKHGGKTDNPSIRIYVNKIENRITFKIKTGYYLELLTPETMKLFGNTKSKLTKDKNDKNVLHLEVTEVVTVHCNMLAIIISNIQAYCIHLFQVNHLINY